MGGPEPNRPAIQILYQAILSGNNHPCTDPVRLVRGVQGHTSSVAIARDTDV